MPLIDGKKNCNKHATDLVSYYLIDLPDVHLFIWVSGAI